MRTTRALLCLVVVFAVAYFQDVSAGMSHFSAIEYKSSDSLIKIKCYCVFWDIYYKSCRVFLLVFILYSRYLHPVYIFLIRKPLHTLSFKCLKLSHNSIDLTVCPANAEEVACPCNDSCEENVSGFNQDVLVVLLDANANPMLLD